MTERAGLLAGGNFIVDRVKVVDCFPHEEMLANILSESVSNGGGPYNLLKDLAQMECGFPLAAVGLVGEDAPGDAIVDDCRQHGINVDQVHRTNTAPTSYTDVMSVAQTGKRTFFHHRGTNAHLDAHHFDFSSTSARFFYLGYLNLLDRLDQCGAGTSGAARVLEAATNAGLTTCVDMVSIDTPAFRQVALAALPWTDHLLVNETEAAKTLGTDVEADSESSLLDAASRLLGAGVRRCVIVHSRFGAAACTADGQSHYQPALKLSADFPVRGATGAGDAFAAGYIAALHGNQPLQDCLLLGVSAAAMSLTDATPSGGLKPIPQCLALAE